MNEKEMLELLQIPEISGERQYWLIRTESGQWWEQFKSEGFVGINWNEISDLEKLSVAQDNGKSDATIQLKNRIEEIHKSETGKITQGGRALNQILRFIFDINVGDIVMIPSRDSEFITFGEVTSELIMYNPTTEELDNERCHYTKRRQVNWVKEVSKKQMDPILFRMLQAHQTISNANSYASEIDRTLEPIYIKDGKCYLTLMVKRTKDVKANHFRALFNLVYDVFGEDSDEIETKIDVQSPGPVQFISSYPWTILGVLIIFTLVGADFAELDFSNSASAKGLGFKGVLYWWDQFQKQNLEKIKIYNEYDIASREMVIKEKDAEQKREREAVEIEQLRAKYKKEIEELEISLPNVLDNVSPSEVE